jgi:hypothetical protein
MLRITLLLTLLLAGCASPPHCPPLPGGPGYCLQNTSAVPAFSALQDVRLQRHAMDERLISQLEVDADGMRLVGLTPMGQRILEARFDNRQATAESLAGERVDARALLVLIQLATWPADSVRAGLRWGWTLEDSATRRRVLRGEETVLMVERSGTPPSYRHLDIHLPRAELHLSVDRIEDPP